MYQSVRDRIITEIKLDFETNGTTLELDDLDRLMMACRRQRIIGGPRHDELSDQRMQSAIEKARRVLGNMRPLGNRQHCAFCRNNSEEHRVYSTHKVKNERDEVTCPILARYVCPMCGATGKKAHTIKYCPFNDGIGTAEALFKTPRNGAGRPRK